MSGISDEVWEDLDMVLNRRQRFSRLTTDQQQLTESRMAAFLASENIEDEEDVPFECEDGDDVDYIPSDEAASDAEEHLNIENNDEVDSDCEEEEAAVEEEVGEVTSNLPAGEFYASKDGVVWEKNPPVRYRPHAHNVPVVGKSGPSSVMQSQFGSPINIFKKFITPEMVSVIVRETNRKASHITRDWNIAHPDSTTRVWTATNENEMYAFFGLLLFAGMFNSNTQPAKELWQPYHHDIYKATMSLNRFKILLRYIRFDNGNTRPDRAALSKSAAIDDLWIMLNDNLQRAYVPSTNLTIDEQLFPYRGRTRFTQYIPSKPAKYGIKVWWICDAKTNYPLKGEIYTGKIGDLRDVQQGKRVVLSLAQKFNGTGRTIYCDNFFTSLALAEELRTLKLAIVGTVRSNKRFVPEEFKKSKNRQVKETLFGYHNGQVSLCSYVPKKNKAVILLSTEHYTSNVDISNKNKPYQILDYNENKSGVDTMDQMLSGYSCKRGTNRWPLAMFYNILDIAGLASFIVYDTFQPSRKSDKRRIFLNLLATELVTPHMENRAMNTHVSRWPGISAAMAKFNVVAPLNEKPTSSSGQPAKKQRKDCAWCNLNPDKKRRKTFLTCDKCNKFMCLEHGSMKKVCLCHECAAAF